MSNRPVYIDLEDTERRLRAGYASLPPSDDEVTEISRRASEANIQWAMWVMAELNRGTDLQQLIRACGCTIANMVLNVDNKIAGDYPPSEEILTIAYGAATGMLERSEEREIVIPKIEGGNA